MSTDRSWPVGLLFVMRQVLINSTLLQLSRMLMHGAAILDFEVRVGEVLPTFRVAKPTSGGIPVEISNWELGNSDF